MNRGRFELPHPITRHSLDLLIGIRSAIICSDTDVEDSDPRVTNDDDESGLWTEVVSKKKKTDVSIKKKPYVLLTTNLGGKQSEKRINKLTLFTKSN
jgi:hypothetical protein